MGETKEFNIRKKVKERFHINHRGFSLCRLCSTIVGQGDDCRCLGGEPIAPLYTLHELTFDELKDHSGYIFNGRLSSIILPGDLYITVQIEDKQQLLDENFRSYLRDVARFGVVSKLEKILKGESNDKERRE